MAVSYKKLWHILVDRNMKKKDLEEATSIREDVAVEHVSCEPSKNLKELFPEEYGEDDSFEEEETEQA